MALKFEIESLESLEENLHALYREDGGKYFLDVEGVRPTADVEKVKNALEAERKEKKQYKDQYTTWETRFTGKTPDEVLAQLERIPLLEAESQGKVDPKKYNDVLETTVKQRLAPVELEKNKLSQTIAEKEQVIAQYQAADRRRTIHDAVRAEAVKAGFQDTTYASGSAPLMLMAAENLTINSVGEVIVDEGKSYTSGLPVREFLGELKNQHSYMLKTSMGGGAEGTKGAAGGGGGSSGNPFKGDNMTARGQFMNENKKNPDKIAAAVRAAGLSNPYELHKDK
jgi:hypothetical protein